MANMKIMTRGKEHAMLENSVLFIITPYLCIVDISFPCCIYTTVRMHQITSDLFIAQQGSDGSVHTYSIYTSAFSF